MSEVLAVRPPVPSSLRAANLGGKAGLLLLLLLAMLHPEAGHMQDKAAGLRTVGYPLLSFTVPVLWLAFWKERFAFPWLADLFVTLTCFTDILGNRMDFYDSIVWFDDWMHFMNTGLLAAALLLLTMDRSVSRWRLLERALAFGATAAIAWELAEYAAFISSSSEKRFAYADTLGDLCFGTFGAVVAALAVYAARRRPIQA